MQTYHQETAQLTLAQRVLVCMRELELQCMSGLIDELVRSSLERRACLVLALEQQTVESFRHSSPEPWQMTIG